MYFYQETIFTQVKVDVLWDFLGDPVGKTLFLMQRARVQSLVRE